ncbi:MAG: hypothetical protein IID15_05735 [Candidatus Marinimicrobia bacterium]|nr:hypothetical protein [Candidatus Neomarinimicrobiota bacterium]
MGRNALRNIFLTSLLGLIASGCAGLSSQSDVKFPGYHAADGITPSNIDRYAEPYDPFAEDIRNDELADRRYRSQYGVTDYGLLSHIYGPYSNLSWRDRYMLDYRSRLSRSGYGRFYDPYYYDPYGYYRQGSLWGSTWYDPWGWNSLYGDPYYYSSRYRYGYSYSYGSRNYGYRRYTPVYGSASSKAKTATKRRGRNRKDGAGSTVGTRFSGNPSYAEAPKSSGKSRSVTKSRGSSRNSGSGVKSSRGKTSSGTKSSSSSGKTKSRRSKRKS